MTQSNVRNGKAYYRTAALECSAGQGIPESFPCSAYGDAMLAALGCGALDSFAALRGALPTGTVLQPNEQTHQFYAARYPIFRDLYLENRQRLYDLN